jgi:hypothetical protein
MRRVMMEALRELVWYVRLNYLMQKIIEIRGLSGYNIVESFRFTLSTMSTASKLTLASTLASAVGIVIFVHYAQKSEQSVSPRPTIVKSCADFLRQCTPACSEIWNSRK